MRAALVVVALFVHHAGAFLGGWAPPWEALSTHQQNSRMMRTTPQLTDKLSARPGGLLLRAAGTGFGNEAEQMAGASASAKAAGGAPSLAESELAPLLSIPELIAQVSARALVSLSRRCGVVVIVIEVPTTKERACA